MNAKLNFNHEFTEKFSVLDEKRFKNKTNIESINTIDLTKNNENKLETSHHSTSKKKLDATNNKLSKSQVKVKAFNSTVTPSPNFSKKTAHITKYSQSNKQTNLNTIAVCKQPLLPASTVSTKKRPNIVTNKSINADKTDKNSVKPPIKQQPIIVKKFTPPKRVNEPLSNLNNLAQTTETNGIVNKKRTVSTTSLNCKAKLLNRVKKPKKQTQIDNKVSTNLLNELMTSLITYLNESKPVSSNDDCHEFKKKDKEKKLNKKRAKEPTTSTMKTSATFEDFYSYQSEPFNNPIMEQYLINTFTDPMDTKTNIFCTSPILSTAKSNSSSCSSRVTNSSNSSSSYFKMFSRPSYYKTFKDIKNKNAKPLPPSSTCSSVASVTRSSSSSSSSSLSLSTYNPNSTTCQMQSSLYLSCDEIIQPMNDKLLKLSNKSTSSSSMSSSQRPCHLEIPNNIEDPILFIDTLYNQLIANNSNISNYRDLSDTTQNTEKLYSAYDTDFTCPSSSQLIISPDQCDDDEDYENLLVHNTHSMSSRRSSLVAASSSSIEINEIQSNENSNLLLTRCFHENKTDSNSNNKDTSNKLALFSFSKRRKSFSNFCLNKNDYHAITVDCMSREKQLQLQQHTDMKLELKSASSSQSSPSLSYFSQSGAVLCDSMSHNRAKQRLKTNRTMYLSASMANLYSSSSFSPSLSTSMSSNQQNTSLNSSANSTTNTNNLNIMTNSFTSSLKSSASISYLYRNPSTENSNGCPGYFSNNASLLMAKSSVSGLSSEANADSSPNYIQILFESFLKSFRFLIMTKNVLIVPIIIYLLQNKLKQLIRSTPSPASSLFSSAASSFVSTATKSTKLKLDLS